MMNPQEMLRLIDSISRDRNVEKEDLYKDIEQAMVPAARKAFNAVDTEEFSCELDRISGKIRLWRGEDEVDLDSLGRIPAQTAKQVMIQRFREDERNSIFNEYVERIGELVTGTAQRYEGGSLVASIGSRTEGYMPRKEQIPGEQHQPGERVRCMIQDVRESGNQVKIILTRAHQDFIRRLFEVEVPEINERVIEIKVMAREPGHRSKIAVASIDSKVDAVGACVGVRGSRIKNIVDELGGEKIDIVRWNESSQIFIQNALKPAEVVEINLCFELGRATVVVNDDQLSLAIGKRGQNVRLAARLTNWDVDILTPEEFTKTLDAMEQALKNVPDITGEQIDRLAAMGIISVFDIEEVGAEYVAQVIDCELAYAETLCKIATANAKILAEEHQKQRDAQANSPAKASPAAAPAPGDAQAASILGDLLGSPATEAGTEKSTQKTAEQEQGSIVDMLEDRQTQEEEPEQTS